MQRIESLRRRLETREVVLLDGGMGTEIQRRGVSTALPLWSAGAVLSHPETVKEIHLEYIRSGADIITTNTFRTNERTFRHAGMAESLAAELTSRACDLAREARGESGRDDVLIAGEMAPLEDCYRVDLVPEQRALAKEHAAWAESLARCGVDFLFVETMNCIRETLAASEAAAATGLPFAVSYVPSGSGGMLSGETAAELLDAVMPFGPFAILINCRPPAEMQAALEHLVKASSIPTGVYGNGLGHPDDAEGWIFDGGTAGSQYLEYARQWVKAGALVVGGCCGTTPEYIRMLAGLKEKQELK